MPEWELLASLLVGVGLSAASGLRIFIPPLVLSMAGLYFHLPLPEPIQWLSSETAFFILLAATLFEIGAYYVPWLDNLLDTVATPMAVVAGTLITSSFIHELDPVWQWSLALVAGGMAAGTVQSLTTVSRLASTGLTAGLGNPVVATLENALSLFFAIGTILFPLATLLILFLFLSGIIYGVRRWSRKPPSPSS